MTAYVVCTLMTKASSTRPAPHGRCSTSSWRSTERPTLELMVHALLIPRRGRGRPLNPEVAERRRWVAETTERLQPASVRQIAYQAEVAGLIPKTENGFRRIQHDLLVLRQQGVIEYDWISDNTRWMRKSRSYRGIDHFIKLSIDTYRRDLWHDAPAYVEIWIEKDALAGTVLEVTNPYDVPLMVARGFSSETYLYEAAQAIAGEDKPAYIYAFFDHDPSGGHSAKHIERKLREFAPNAEIHFELVASPNSRSWIGSCQPARPSAERTRTPRTSWAIAANSMPSLPIGFVISSVCASSGT